MSWNEDVPPRPLPNCYWVEPGKLLAGEYPGAPSLTETRSKLARLLDAGVRTFIDLTEEGELNPYADLLGELAAGREVRVVHHRFPIPDTCIPASAVQMQAIVTAIQEGVAHHPIVYVHCWGGIGRTGTAIGCHLVQRGRTGEEALAHLADLWKVMEKRYRQPRTPDTEEQHEYVRRWGNKA